MTVVEAVGLALGVAPLIMELLNANSQSLRALKAPTSRSTEETMEEFSRDLQFEVSMLKITLTRLVDDLPIQKELKEKLTDEKRLDPMVWKDPSQELRSLLERRLNSHLGLFVHTMENILRLLAKLVDRRSLPFPLSEKQIQACADTSYAKLEEFFDTRLTEPKRLNLRWKKDKRDKLMRDFAKYNRRLEDIVMRGSDTDIGHIPPRPRSMTGFTRYLGLRPMMGNLPRAIVQSWCKCAGRHELRFGLSMTWKSEDQVRMDMIINLSKDTTKWCWGESKINFYLKESPHTRTVDLSPDIRNPNKERSFSLSENIFFGSLSNNSLSDWAGPSLLDSPSEVSDDEAEREERQGSQALSSSHRGGILVLDICTTIEKAQRVKRASQLTFHDDSLWHQPTTTDIEVPQSYPGVPLTSYLQKGKMRMKDRKILQVLLAQSVLFFPWNGQGLNKNSITFYHDMQKPFATFAPDYSDDPMGKLSDLLETEYEFKPYANETLAALAITLLEIELQQPIEEFQTQEDMDVGDSNFVTNFWTTVRVLKEQESDMYRGCYEAIDACLKCDFKDEASTFEDPGFLQEVYERVVEPLEQELQRGFAIHVGAPDPNADDRPHGATTSVRVSKSDSDEKLRVAEGPQLDIVGGGPRNKVVRTVRIASPDLTTAA